jgi:hypothetical protein
MDLRTSALVACITWALGATIAAVGMLAFLDRDVPPRRTQVASFRPSQPQNSQLSVAARNQLNRQAEVARSLNVTVANLETSLAASRKRVQAAEKEVARLRAESNASIEMAIELLEQAPPDARDTDADSEADAARPELPAPTEGSGSTPSQAPESGETLESLREEIAEKNRDFDELEAEQEATLARLLRRDLAMRDEAARILTRLGAQAAGEVAESLRHPDAEVRIWAANVLTKLGILASDTVGDLQTASKDEDPRVRSAVNEALRAVMD